MATKEESIEQAIAQTYAIAEAQGRLKLSREILAECRAIKDSFKPVPEVNSAQTLEEKLNNIAEASKQMGALRVISKMLDVIEIRACVKAELDELKTEIKKEEPQPK